MKTNLRSLLIASLLFDIIFIYFSASFVPSIKALTFPQFPSFITITIVVNQDLRIFGIWQITIFGTTISFYPIEIFLFYAQAIFIFIGNVFYSLGLFFFYIYQIITATFSLIPQPLGSFVEMFIIGTITIALFTGIKIVATQLDGSGE